jgi:hypothetical protein
VCGGDAEHETTEELEADTSINCEGPTETYVCLFITCRDKYHISPVWQILLECTWRELNPRPAILETACSTSELQVRLPMWIVPEIGPNGNFGAH